MTPDRDAPVSGPESLAVDPFECDEELLASMTEQAEVLGGRGFHEMTPADARIAFAEVMAWYRAKQGPKQPVAEVIDTTMPYGSETIRIRVYRPSLQARAPVLVYFHGSGFVLGDIDCFDDTARLLCNEIQATVLNVEYLLAPEHRFPQPLLSCVESISWAKEHAESFGGDADRVVVIGDSAGGNLAAAAALDCARRGIDVAGQVVLYGTLVHPDFAQQAGVNPWSRRGRQLGPPFEWVSWYWDNYMASPEQGADPRASVLLDPDLSGAPPAYVAVGMLDTFWEENVRYGERLADSGVAVRVSEYPRLTHGYLQHGRLPRGARSQLAYEAAMDTCANVREIVRP